MLFLLALEHEDSSNSTQWNRGQTKESTLTGADPRHAAAGLRDLCNHRLLVAAVVRPPGLSLTRRECPGEPPGEQGAD